MIDKAHRCGIISIERALLKDGQPFWQLLIASRTGRIWAASMLLWLKHKASE